jgi:membrane fusion protein, multidrug efflux system
MKKIIIISLAALFLAACGGQTPEEKQKKIDSINAKIKQLETKKSNLLSASDTVKVDKIYPIKVQPLKVETISKIVSFSANLNPYEEVYLAPASPGRIEQIFVKIGDRVKKGDLLAKMDETQLNNAKLQLAQLETDFERMKTLRESNSISAQQFEQVKTQVEVTRASVNFLSENTKLVAPFNGVITGKYFENGELYSGAPNTQAGKAAIVIIQQIDQLKAVISVSEKYYTQLKTGISLKITSEIYSDKVFSGKIDRIYPTIDPLSRSFKIEVKVNSEGKLRPGMFSQADLNLGEVEAIVVPDISIIQQEGTNIRYVFINHDGVAKRVKVELGERINDQLEIISNEIKVGDELIVAGQAVIMDGSKVKVTM